MGKVSQIVTGSIVSVLLVGTSVSALDSSISGTGPDSYNAIYDNSDFRCEVSNNNDVDIDNETDQSASSGDATSSGNTSGGSATSGSASNSNSTVVDVVISNGNACVPANNVTPETPPTGGQGGQVGGVSTEQEVGGMGAGGEVQQVAAPVGGVGAGAGGSAFFTLVGSLAAMLYGGLRLKHHAEAGRF